MADMGQIFTQNPFFRNPEEFMRNAQRNGANIHTTYSNNTSNNFNVFNNSNGPGQQNQRYPNWNNQFYDCNQGYPNQNQTNNFGNYNQRRNYQRENKDEQIPGAEKQNKGMQRHTQQCYEEGNELYRAGGYKKALVKYKRALEYEENWKIVKNIAHCYKRLGMFKEAYKYIKRAVEINEDEISLYRHGGIIAFSLFRNSEKLEDGERGEAFFKKAFELKNSEENFHNYFLSRKIIYVFKQKASFQEKTELLEYLKDENKIVAEHANGGKTQFSDNDYLKRNYFDRKIEVPEHLKGKISLEIMRDPVQTICGVSYEKENIIKSVENNGMKDPSTNEPFWTKDCLIYNKHLKKHIKDYINKNKWVYKEDDMEKDWKLFEFK